MFYACIDTQSVLWSAQCTPNLRHMNEKRVVNRKNKTFALKPACRHHGTARITCLSLSAQHTCHCYRWSGYTYHWNRTRITAWSLWPSQCLCQGMAGAHTWFLWLRWINVWVNLQGKMIMYRKSKLVVLIGLKGHKIKRRNMTILRWKTVVAAGKSLQLIL